MGRIRQLKGPDAARFFVREERMVIDTSKLKISTKGLVALFVAFGGFMQIPAVNQFVLSLTTHHKRAAAVVTAIGGIYAVLHDPQVQDALGIKHTREIVDKTEEVKLATEVEK
jgi:hypothetical protein